MQRAKRVSIPSVGIGPPTRTPNLSFGVPIHGIVAPGVPIHGIVAPGVPIHGIVAPEYCTIDT